MRSLRFLPWRDRQSRCDDVSDGAHTAKERPRSTHDHPTFPCSRIDRFIHLPSSSPFFRQLAGGSFWSRSGSKLLLLVDASFVDDCMEIVIASCRERVCQYGLISVVPGSL